MTEAEREELAEQMARRIDDFINDTTDWRKVLAVEIARNLCIDKKDFDTLDHGAKEYFLTQARAALAVAEPVIREQCVKMVEKSFAIMAGEATNVKHLEWPRHPYKMMPRHIWNWYWTRTLPRHWRLMRAARAAIREGGKDDI